MKSLTKDLALGRRRRAASTSELGLLPRLEPLGRVPARPTVVVLVLHGGRVHSRESGNVKRVTYYRMLPFARMLMEPRSAVYMLRYRFHGWNGPAADALQDAEWALRALHETHPDVPVVTVGHSMGGRAALDSAAAPNVTAVCALAPWLEACSPVTQLTGRNVLIVHGDRDPWTDPGESLSYAMKARQQGIAIACYWIRDGGHFMLRRATNWRALVHQFVRGAAGLAPAPTEMWNALDWRAGDDVDVAR